MSKSIYIETDRGRRFLIDTKEIAEDRADYYAKLHQKRGEDFNRDEEIEHIMSDDADAIDWLRNNMNWWECKTLYVLPSRTVSRRDEVITQICGTDDEKPQ